MSDERPSGARLAAALLAASVAAPAPLALIMTYSEPAAILGALLMVTLFGFPIALVHAALLGLPAYLLMRRRWRLRWWHAVPAGALIGALPSLLLWGDTQSALLLFACGALGGLIFWLVARTPSPARERRRASPDFHLSRFRPKQRGGPLPDRPHGDRFRRA